MNIILSNKGGQKLCYGGYMYTVKATTNNSTRWECSARKSAQCNGFVRTDINDINDILSSGPHNHPFSDIDVAVTTKKMKIKTDLIQTAGAGGNTHQTLLTHLSTLTPIERANFGSSTSAKRSFNRRVASGRPDEPDSLANLIIQGIWAEDQDGIPFLLHDNHNNANRIIVFASERCLRYLANSHDWFMDGTFKVCPTLFDQLYVIRAPLDQSSISLVYTLLTNRREETYRELLQILQAQ